MYLTVDDNKVAVNNINSTLNSDTLSDGLYAYEPKNHHQFFDLLVVRC